MAKKNPVPYSTHETTVKCYGCHVHVPVDEAVYGTTPYEPMHGPEHYCKDQCVELLAVVEYVAIKPRF